MSKLIPDIFALIIKELDNDYNTLFSCLLANKLWCELTIPILWKDCLNHYRSNEKNISLVKILFTFLSEESKNLLINNEINLSFIQTRRPLFNYISYCKSIITFDVTKVIKDCFEPPLLRNQEMILEEEFYDMILNKCSNLNRLEISHKLYYKKQDMMNFMKLKDNLSNIVELTFVQHLDESIFYNLAEICVNIKKLELRGSNKINSRGLIKLIEVQNKLECFIYSGQKGHKGQNWDNFCEMIGKALIKHKNTLKHIHGDTRLCIPPNILYSFVNLETLMLGYSTKTMNGLHLVKLPKLLSLRVCYLTEVKELIQNTSGYLKTIKIHNQSAKNIKAEDIIQIIIAIYQNCPKLEHFCIPFVDTIDDALGDLLVHCNQLEYIEIYGRCQSLNGDVILKILSKSTSKKLERIEMKGSWKFSVESLEEFLNKLKENNYSLYFKFGLNDDCLNEEFSSVIQNFVDDNVLKINPLNYI